MLTGDEETLRDLSEGFPGQGFSIVGDNDDSHQQAAESLEAELLFLNIMEYSENAKDCLQIVINEAKQRQAEAVEVAF